MNWSERAEFIRSLVRPTVTWLLLGSTVVFVAAEVPMPAEFWELVKLATLFWFIERSLNKRK